ncbi:helix-turn-helix domain-containing protein [Flagellimonas aurea]|uniref:helix-turn-helix domain-containing protein n=1 Tax=Flagellimonas aurea TaxID=2915619 RepID=UPI0035CF1D5D
MDSEEIIKDYSIDDIINYRSLSILERNDFFYLSEIPNIYEPFLINPNYYSFGMITDGSMKIKIMDEVSVMGKNTLMVYRPKETFKIVEIEQGTKGLFVLFTKEFVNVQMENIFTLKNSSFLSYGAQVFFELSNKDRNVLHSVFHSIFYLLDNAIGNYWETMARNLTSALIFQTEFILKGYIDVEQIHISKDEIVYRSFNNLIMQHFKHERSLGFYGEKMNMNPNHLGVIIKKVTGKSPSKMINTLLINEAKRLLKSTDSTVGMVAYALNFSDIHTFSKFFKRLTGYTPVQFRGLPDLDLKN